MAASAGAVYVDVRGNTKPFESSMSRLGGIAKKVGGTIAAALTVKAAFDFGRQCVALASDLSEVQNVVDVTFSRMSGKVDEWASRAAESFGLSETMAKRYVGTFGSMAEAFGFAESEAYDMATALTGLAGDVASFYNMSQDAAYTKLKSVFSGETESLKELGVVMTQSALDQYALANGYGRTTAAMSEQEKVSLRLAFVQNALSNASGDFARTSGSWANQTRLLSLRFEELKATLGQSLIAVLLPVVRVINTVIAGLNQAAKALGRFIEAITGKSMGELTGGVAQVAVEAGGAAETAADGIADLATAQGDAAGAAKAQDKAQKALNRTLAGFDKINKLSSESDASGGGAGGDAGGGTGGGVGFGDAVAGEAGKAQKALSSLTLPKRLLDGFAELRSAVGGVAETISGGLAWVWENVLRPLGEWTISEALPPVVEGLAAAFRILNVVLTQLGKAWDWVWKNFFAPIAGALGDSVAGALELIAKALGGVASFAEKHPTLFTTLAAGLALFAGRHKIVTALGTAIGNVSRVIMAHPIASILTAIALAAGYIYKNWDWIKDTPFGKAISAVGEKITKLLPIVEKKLVGAFNIARDAVGKAWPVIKEKLGAAFQKVGEVATWLWKNALVPLGKFLGDVFTGKNKAANKAMVVLKGAFDALSKVATRLWKNALVPLGKFLGDVFKGAWNALKKPMEVVGGAFDALGKAAEWVWKNVLQPIGEFLGGAFSTAAGVAEGAVSGLKGVWDGIKNKTAELTTKVTAAAGGTVSALKSAWDGVTDKASQLTTKVVAAKGGAVSTLKTAWSAVKDKTAQLTTKATDAIKGGLSGLKSSWAAIKSKTITLTAKAAQSANTIKSWWSARSDEWKNKTASYTVSKDGTPVASIKSWWSARSDEWKNKTSWFNLNAGTTANTVSGWWSNVAGQWYDKTAYLTMKAEVTGVRKISIKPGKEGVNDIYSVTPEYFAQGGWVARNTPRLAVIGDNRREGEIVSPESKFQSMLDKASAQGGGADALLPVLRDILVAIESLDTDVYLDGQAITRRVVSNVNAQARATGRSAIIV